MTPAERARQIDKEEFAAECAAVRQRALAYAEECRARECNHIENWLGREVQPVKFTTQPIGRQPASIPYNGESRTLAHWAAHLGVSIHTLITRRRRLGTFGAAIAMGGPQRQRRTPGVVSNLSERVGTGAGRHA